MRNTLRNYERPDGWSKGQPEVLVAKNIIPQLGEPAVNYDSLHQYLTDDLEIPYEDKTFIKLYGRFRHSIVGGFHVPFTRTLHVNAVAAERERGSMHRAGVMGVVAHEARHRADSRNHRIRTAAEVAARWATYKVGFEVAPYIPELASHAPIVGGAARLLYYGFEPPEIRARRAEKSIVDTDHETDIVFPNTARASLLVLTGRLPEETVRQFGPDFERIHEAVSSGELTVTVEKGGAPPREAPDPQIPA